ncbi:transmembrane emp24 domain-containing protein p24delta9-like protein [Carex littledalei]|uniref:Transmembrane emp24 domain-containing protein p24delta9-like protein n=1 Tax=Carex littledalei TaxID=544730 RepID=A0A833V409_9POAL|nr:transmembrane emp24 domain-containing protein p24delta9-like protein [Carex littledalei]
MAIPSLALLSALVVLCLLTSPVRCLRFDLQSGQIKCISEEIKINAMTVGKYSIANPSESVPLPESHRVSIKVTSPYGESMHSAENVDSGSFAFVTKEAGDYLACFWTPEHKPAATISFEFEWKSGVTAKDWSNVAKKGQVELMEVELKKLEDVVKSIHDEMFYLRSREEEMQDMNRSTNTRMAWLSFLSLVLCLSVAGLQIWHLKTFFERKKLL